MNDQDHTHAPATIASHSQKRSVVDGDARDGCLADAASDGPPPLSGGSRRVDTTYVTAYAIGGNHVTTSTLVDGEEKKMKKKKKKRRRRKKKNKRTRARLARAQACTQYSGVWLGDRGR
jgi:hypothetical protein